MTPTTAQAAARLCIGSILDGLPPDGADPAALGMYAECYQEMVRAYQTGGTEAARRVFLVYAEQDPAFAALRAGDPPARRRKWSAADLMAATFPEPRWLVPGLLPVGQIILGARPKQGKSILSLQIAGAVASGGVVLGRQAQRAKVLYLALEDSERRIQDRLRKQRAPADLWLDVRFDWPPLAEQGTAELIAEVDKCGYGLVIVDTISRALGRADQMDLGEMNVIMGSLQRFALDRDISLLLVDHHRKSAANGNGDAIDDVMGSTSKAAVADAAWGIYRERGKSGATLKVTGRDLEDLELALQWDPELQCWQSPGTAGAVRAETVQADIVLALGEYGGEATAPELASFLGKRAHNITRELQELCAKGVVVRGEKRGKTVPYRLVRQDGAAGES